MTTSIGPLAATRATNVRYELALEDGARLQFDVDVDRPPSPLPGEVPSWMSMERRCRDCTLPSDARVCPAALDLAPIFDAVARFKSHTRVETLVTIGGVDGRTVRKQVPMQEALRSLIGLVMATSGCPIAGRLRSLAQDHHPFADEDETRERVLELVESISASTGRDNAQTLAEIEQLYRMLTEMNRDFARRLTDLLPGDAGKNAILGLFSMSIVVGEELAEGNTGDAP